MVLVCFLHHYKNNKKETPINKPSRNNSETVKAASFRVLLNENNKLLPVSKPGPPGSGWWRITISYMIVITQMKAVSPGDRPRIPNMFSPLNQSFQRHALIQPSFSLNCGIYRNFTLHGSVRHVNPEWPLMWWPCPVYVWEGINKRVM